MSENAENIESKRRPLKSRDHKLAKQITTFLVSKNISPNMISVISIIFATIGMLSIITMKDGITIINTVIAVIGIQGRLLCNLFDGMVAVESGKTSQVGELYNEIPDRVSDTLLLLPLGYIITGYEYSIELAWSGVFLALFTAYIRNLGTALGITTFAGIMAKQKRMALLTVTLIISLCFKYTGVDVLNYTNIIYVMLITLNLGCLLTVITRLSIIIKFLKQKEV